jgi:hypothetical protein
MKRKRRKGKQGDPVRFLLLIMQLLRSSKLVVQKSDRMENGLTSDVPELRFETANTQCL